MGTPRFTPECKEETVRQITERAYSFADVSEHVGVSGSGSCACWILRLASLSFSLGEKDNQRLL